eukprot:gene9872-biopygen8627
MVRPGALISLNKSIIAPTNHCQSADSSILNKYILYLSPSRPLPYTYVPEHYPNRSTQNEEGTEYGNTDCDRGFNMKTQDIAERRMLGRNSTQIPEAPWNPLSEIVLRTICPITDIDGCRSLSVIPPRAAGPAALPDNGAGGLRACFVVGAGIRFPLGFVEGGTVRGTVWDGVAHCGGTVRGEGITV